MKRVCRECGAAVPDGHTACPLCGKVAPADEAPADVSRDLVALQGELSARSAKKAAVSRLLKGVEAVLFVLAIPVVLPGLALTALWVKRWGHVPLSLVIGEGALITGLSYLGFERGDSPLGGVVFPLMVLSCLSVAALYVLRAWKGRAEGGILLGYSGLVTLLMAAGGLLLYSGAGLVAHRLRAPRFLKIISDVPLRLASGDALARRELLPHVELVDASLDDAKAAWRVLGGGADVFCAAEAEREEPEEASAAELFQKAGDWAGRRVALRNSDKAGVGKKIPEDWLSFVRFAIAKGPSRYWMPVGGQPKAKIYLVSELLEEDDPRGVLDVLDLEAPVGLLAEIPLALLESSNGLDQRGRAPGDAKGLALLTDAAPRRYCAPVKGTSGALWVQAPEDAPPSGTFQGVMEWPEDGAGRSLAALARREPGADAAVRPRVLVLGSAAAYRNAHGLTVEAAEGIPLQHWAMLLIGAVLVGVAVFFALFE